MKRSIVLIVLLSLVSCTSNDLEKKEVGEKIENKVEAVVIDNNSEVNVENEEIVEVIEVEKEIVDLDALKKAVEGESNDYMDYYRLGNAYMDMKDFLSAKETFIKGISLNGDYEELHLSLGNTYFSLDERDNGYTCYNDGLKVCSELCDDFFYYIGLRLAEDGNLKEAKKGYQKALFIDPENKQAKVKFEELNN